MSFSEIKSAVDKIGENFDEFKKRTDAQLKAIDKRNTDCIAVWEGLKKELGEGGSIDLPYLKERVEELEASAKMPRKPSSYTGIAGLDTQEVWRDRKTGLAVPVLGHKDRFSATDPNKTGVSVGRWLRGILTGKYADDVKQLNEEAKALATSPDASGGYTVPQPLASEFIDLLRAKLVLSQAGARAVPMTSKTLSLAKLTGDASVSWHAENASVTDSDPTFDSVTLSAKTCVGLVKFSLELSQDSLNVEEMITRSLTSGVALAIDAAGLGTTAVNGPSGVRSFQSRQRVQGVGTLTNYDPWLTGMGKLLQANVPLEKIGASIMGPLVWTSLAKLKTGIASDNTPLPKPSALTSPFLVTTSASVLDGGGSPGGIAYLADWSDLLYGIRKEISLYILREQFLGSNLQIAALIYCRVDFAAAREASFCTIEDIS